MDSLLVARRIFMPRLKQILCLKEPPRMKVISTLVAALFFVGCATADSAEKADPAPVAETAPAKYVPERALTGEAEKPAPEFAHMHGTGFGSWPRAQRYVTTVQGRLRCRSYQGAVHTPYRRERYNSASCG